MDTTTTTKRITLATVKAFIRRNHDRLLIRNLSNFDGMTDCVEFAKAPKWRKATRTDRTEDHTLGIEGAWFVLRSRDYIQPLNEPGYTGFNVCNCCVSFDLAVPNA